MATHRSMRAALGLRSATIGALGVLLASTGAIAAAGSAIAVVASDSLDSATPAPVVACLPSADASAPYRRVTISSSVLPQFTSAVADYLAIDPASAQWSAIPAAATSGSGSLVVPDAWPWAPVITGTAIAQTPAGTQILGLVAPYESWCQPSTAAEWLSRNEIAGLPERASLAVLEAAGAVEDAADRPVDGWLPASPTTHPTAETTETEPAIDPTVVPTDAPTTEPTALPTRPTVEPTAPTAPTTSPTAQPTAPATSPPVTPTAPATSPPVTPTASPKPTASTGVNRPESAPKATATRATPVTQAPVKRAATPTTGDLNISVWLDLNADGKRADGEPALPFVMVAATHAEGTSFDGVTSDTGSLVFNALATGTWTVDVSVPEGLQPATDDGGSRAMASTVASLRASETTSVEIALVGSSTVAAAAPALAGDARCTTGSLTWWGGDSQANTPDDVVMSTPLVGGGFSVSGMPAGRYDAAALCDGAISAAASFEVDSTTSSTQAMSPVSDTAVVPVTDTAAQETATPNTTPVADKTSTGSLAHTGGNGIGLALVVAGITMLLGLGLIGLAIVFAPSGARHSARRGVHRARPAHR